MSLTIKGLLVAVGLPLLVQFGFSDSCSNELVAKLAPILATLPGIITAWVGRIRLGGINALGMRTE